MKRYTTPDLYNPGYTEEGLYEKVEADIKKGNLKDLQKLCDEYTIDFTRNSGILAVLAVAKPEILHFMCEKSPELVKLYGLTLLTAAIWAHNGNSCNFLIKEYHINYEELQGTNVYDYCMEMIGQNQTQAETHDT